MADWHVTPDYIVKNWTDELLYLMVEKRNDRRRREDDATKRPGSQAVKVSDKMLFARGSNLIRVKKNGD